MTRNGKEKGNDVRITTYLRLLFITLCVGSLMQLAMSRCSVYNESGGSFSDQRSLASDQPLVSANRIKHTDSTTIAEPPRDPIPEVAIDPLFRQEQDRIDHGMDNASRCAQYGVEVLPDNEKDKRRLFFGSMLADESHEVITAHAVEVYNKYSVVAFVESDTAHNKDPRTMNYGPGSERARELQESGQFGTANHTKVVIDYWLEDLPFLAGMDREVEQRKTILKIWVDQGMTERDVGIMSDLDEVVSRDFLNALQVCDFPILRYDPKQRPSCQTPKMILSTIQFESSPLCVKKSEWFHPDLIVGSCIAGVGDPSGRVTPEREIQGPGRNAKTFGGRGVDWGKEDYKRYPQDVIDNNRFPLWDGRDIREVNGNEGGLTNFVDRRKGKDGYFGTAYHLHNWFQDMEVLRNKFATYGHFDNRTRTMPLSAISDDVNMMVRCVRGIGNNVTEPEDASPYYENNVLLPEGEEGGSIFSLGGNRPIYFKKRSYVEERHALLQEMVRADEQKYGTIYH